MAEDSRECCHGFMSGIFIFIILLGIFPEFTPYKDHWFILYLYLSKILKSYETFCYYTKDTLEIAALKSSVLAERKFDSADLTK